MLAEKVERDVYDVAQKMRVLFCSSEFWENVRFCVITSILVAILFYAVQIQSKLSSVQNGLNSGISDVREDMKQQTEDITGYVKWRQLRTKTALEDIHGVVIDEKTGKVISRIDKI